VSAPVTPPPAPTVASVTISPASTSVPSGATKQFSVSGTMSDGSAATIKPRYTATGGTISSAGLYTAGKVAGTFAVIATDSASGKADTSSVTVTPVVTSVNVTPGSASVQVGGTTQLSATVLDANGATMSGQTVTWSSSNTGVATVSGSGLVTGVAGGTATITATSSGKQGTAAVTVSAPIADASGCPATYTRRVDVSSQSALTSALSNAQSGDQIRMAAGTYSGGVSITRSNFTLCGPRTAVIAPSSGSYGVYLTNVDNVTLKGFTVQGGLEGVYAKGLTNSRIDSLHVTGQQQEAIHLRLTSTNNVVVANTIDNTGNGSPDFGEGVYVGTAYAQMNYASLDHSNGNQILRNHFGPNVRAELIDTKVGADSGLIEGNYFDGSGQVMSQTWIDCWVTIAGNHWTVRYNTGAHALKNGFRAIQDYDGLTNVGSYNTFGPGNVAEIDASGYGFRMDPNVVGNVVLCGQTVTNAGSGYSNIACK
jgi:hypothetical protein